MGEHAIVVCETGKQLTPKKYSMGKIRKTGTPGKRVKYNGKNVRPTTVPSRWKEGEPCHHIYLHRLDNGTYIRVSETLNRYDILQDQKGNPVKSIPELERGFLQKHWKKIAIGGALAGGVVLLVKELR